MATVIPPPPSKTQSMDSYIWQDWFRLIRDRASAALTSVTWSDIDFTGSNITSIGTRDHNTLTTIQGGTVGEYNHLTDVELANARRDVLMATTAINLSLDDTYQTVVVTASGKTITLPAASTARIGKVWTTILGVNGYVDVSRAGSDTLTLPETNTKIRLNTKGASLSLKCLTATSWGIV